MAGGSAGSIGAAQCADFVSRPESPILAARQQPGRQARRGWRLRTRAQGRQAALVAPCRRQTRPRTSRPDSMTLHRRRQQPGRPTRRGGLPKTRPQGRQRRWRRRGGGRTPTGRRTGRCWPTTTSGCARWWATCLSREHCMKCNGGDAKHHACTHVLQNLAGPWR